MMSTAGCDHITAPELVNWLGSASPGERIVYARGFLVVAVHTADLNRHPDAPALWAVQEAAWKAHQRCMVHLVQRRLGPAEFEYLAVKARCLQTLSFDN
jgi:hypothetical protein